MDMIKKQQELVQIKNLVHLKMYYDVGNDEILFEKDNVYFALTKSEIFPALRGLISGIQRFYKRKHKK